MADKLMRATQTYYAGNQMVKEGTILAEDDPRLIPAYVEAFGGADPPPGALAPKRGRPKKEAE